MVDQDLPEVDTDASLANPPIKTSDGQPSDYEARFKGLQRKYNELEGKHTGATGLQTQLQQQINDLKTQIADISTSSQGDITRLGAEKAALETQLSTEKAARLTAEAAAQKTSKDAEVRKTILSAYPTEAIELLQAYDLGFLPVSDKQGDEIKATIQTYLDFRAGKVSDAVDKTIRGTSPPTLSQGQANGLSNAQLEDWLMTHDESHADFQTFRRAWLNAKPA